LHQDGSHMTNENIIQQQKNQDAKNKLFVRDEFLIQLQKFTSQISRTIKQIEGKIMVLVNFLFIMVLVNFLFQFIESIEGILIGGNSK